MFKKIFLIVWLLLSFTVAALGAAVNINTADLKTLESLPGIGAVKARAIIDYRAGHGGFSAVDDLRKVKGIGRKTLDRLRDQVTVGE